MNLKHYLISTMIVMINCVGRCRIFGCWDR